MIASSVEFYADGHWLACRPAKDLGSLGERILCELTQTPGRRFSLPLNPRLLATR